VGWKAHETKKQQYDNMSKNTYFKKKQKEIT